MLNWLKANRKQLNAGSLKRERVELFKMLLKLIEQNKRINQYVWGRKKLMVLPLGCTMCVGSERL